MVWTPVEGGATDALAPHKVAVKRGSAKVEATDAGLQVVANPKRPSISEAVKKLVQAAAAWGAHSATRTPGDKLAHD